MLDGFFTYFRVNEVSVFKVNTLIKVSQQGPKKQVRYKVTSCANQCTVCIRFVLFLYSFRRRFQTSNTVLFSKLGSVLWRLPRRLGACPLPAGPPLLFSGLWDLHRYLLALVHNPDTLKEFLVYFGNDRMTSYSFWSHLATLGTTHERISYWISKAALLVIFLRRSHVGNCRCEWVFPQQSPRPL